MIEGTTGMWGHKTLRTRFCLCVDDFGLKFYSRTDAEHFLKALGTNYKYTVDWSGTNYCGLTFEWQYEKGYVDVGMPKYI